MYCNWAFQRTHYWIPKIQDGWDPPSWKSTWRQFFSAEGGPIFGDCCNDMSTAVHVVEIETRCRIPIWQTFSLGEFNGMSSQSHVSHSTVLTTWWIYCHDSRATCHIAGCKNSIRHIENRFSPYFIFFHHHFICSVKCSLGFDERRLSYRLRYTCFCKSFSPY